MMLQKRRAIIPLGNLLEITLLLELYRQLIRQFNHLIHRRILLKLPQTLSSRGEEVLVLIHQPKQRIPACKVLLGELDHTVTLVLELGMGIGDVLEVDSFRRCECRPSVDVGVGICNEVFQFFLTLEAVDLAIEECQVFIIFDADLDVLSTDLIADGAEIQVLGDVVEDAVGTEPDMRDIRCGMGHQVSDEVPSGFDFLLDLSFGLFEDSPLREVSIDELDIVVLAVVVSLHLDDVALRGLESLVDHLEVIVVEGLCLFCLADDLLFDLELAHADGENYGWDYAFFVEDFALAFVEREAVEDPTFVAIEERGPLLEESDDCLIRETLACLDLVHDGPDIRVLVFLHKIFNDFLEADDLEAILILDVLGQGTLSALGLANDEDYRHEGDILWYCFILLKGFRIPYNVLSFLFVSEIVYPISVNKRIWLGVLHQRVWIELAESAVRDYVIIEEVIDSEPVDCQHAVLFPSTDPVLDNRLDKVIYAVCDMLDLALTLYVDDFHAPGLECFGEFLELRGVGLSLSLEGFLLLRDHFLQFRDLSVFFLWRFVVFLSSLLRLLPCLFLLLFFLNPSFFFDILELSFNSLSIQHSLQPFLLITGQHEHQFWQFPCLPEQLHYPC